MSTPHVQDELELFALGALPATEMARVASHLADCAVCRSSAASLAEIVNTLSDAVPPREPRAELRDRILAAARAEASLPAQALRRGWALPRLRPMGFALAGLAAAVVALAVVNLVELDRLHSAENVAVQQERIVTKIAPGRTWYMGGGGDWKGSGGTLVAPENAHAFVVFHDLKDVEANTRYALWLVSPEGKWLRGASFLPDGSKLQTVDLSVTVDGYARCVVTLEPASGGTPSAPIVMQSQIAPAKN